MGALEMVTDKRTKASFDGRFDVSERVARQALRNGLDSCRPLGNAIVLAPPFIITEPQIDELFTTLRRTLDEVWAGLAPAAA